MPIGVYDHSKRATVTDEVRKLIYEHSLTNHGQPGYMTNEAFAKKYKISLSTLSRITAIERLKHHTADATVPTSPTPPPAEPETLTVPSTPLPPGKGGHFKHLYPEIASLRQQGYSVSEIATKLNIRPSTVSYYSGKARRESNPQTEGANSNGHDSTLDTRFLVGFGCAELERTLTTIAQRLGIAPNLLRQGFSRFLGSTAIR